MALLAICRGATVEVLRVSSRKLRSINPDRRRGPSFGWASVASRPGDGGFGLTSLGPALGRAAKLAARLTVVASVQAVALLWSTLGHAQSVTQLAGTGQAGLTYTDNLYNASSDSPAEGAQGVEPAAYLILTPGVVLSHRRRLSTYELAYTHSFYRYLTSAEADAHGDMLAATAAYQLNPLDALSFSLQGARSSTASMGMGTTASTGTPQPDASATYYSLSGSEQWTHRYTPRWSGSEAVTVQVTTATGAETAEGRRYSGSGVLGATYALRHDAFGFNWATSYYHTERVQLGDTQRPRARYLATGPAASWSHQFDQYWSSSVNAGMGINYQPDQRDNSAVDAGVSLAPPTLGASLNWSYQYYAATLAYAGATRPDLLTNRVYYSDTVSLDASWLALPRQRVTVSMNHVVSSNSSLISPVEVNQNMDEPTTYTLTSSGSVVWVPVGMLTLALQYLHTAEITKGGGGANPGRDFQRNQVTLTVGWQYPEFNLSRLNQSRSFRFSGSNGDSSDESSGEHESSTGDSAGSSE